VVGSGGREHALTWRLAKSTSVTTIHCAPGNGGTAGLAENVPIDATDLDGLAAFAQEKSIDLTIVGPEAPLVAGIADVFAERGLRVFGPRAAAARIEGSKAFAKDIMAKAGVATAEARAFADCEDARAYVREVGAPIVVKADGLAAGKGVIVAMTVEEAEDALADCFEKRLFGDAGRTVIVEEYLSGQEVSLLAFTEGSCVLPMVPAQDYKRVGDGDAGPNTGGMGCYSPVPIVSEGLRQAIVADVMEPVVRTMAEEDCPYCGVLYGGVILTEDGPKVLEFNARFGDPETQVIMPRFQSDLLEVLLAVVERNVCDYTLHWSDDVCVSVVLASGGYPGPYQTGKKITGLEEAGQVPGVVVFHAGTTMDDDGDIYTAGGRVLNVTATGADFAQARERVYEAIERIDFDGMHYRSDIALRAVGA
jgi:phosphoribosylamine--glycine ligase